MSDDARSRYAIRQQINRIKFQIQRILTPVHTGRTHTNGRGSPTPVANGNRRTSVRTIELVNVQRLYKRDLRTFGNRRARKFDRILSERIFYNSSKAKITGSESQNSLVMLFFSVGTAVGFVGAETRGAVPKRGTGSDRANKFVLGPYTKR